MRKVDVVEQSMNAVTLNTNDRHETTDETFTENEDPQKILNEKVEEVLNRFEEESLVVKTRFVKVFLQNGNFTLGVAHPRIQKKAGPLSFNCCFKSLLNINGNPLKLKTGGQAFTNMDSDQIYGRGNIGLCQCTMIAFEMLKDSIKRRILHTFGYEIPDSFANNETTMLTLKHLKNFHSNNPRGKKPSEYVNSAISLFGTNWSSVHTRENMQYVKYAAKDFQTRKA